MPKLNENETCVSNIDTHTERDNEAEIDEEAKNGAKERTEQTSGDRSTAPGCNYSRRSNFPHTGKSSQRT